MALGELHSEAAEHGGGERHGVADQQEQIPGTRAKSAQEHLADRLEEAGDRRLEPFRGHLHPDEALGAEALRLGRQIVGCLTREPTRPGEAEAFHRAAGPRHLGEGLELPAAEELGEVDELEPEA